MSEVKSQPIGFHFINTTNPRDATSPHSLSRIRSHAARDIRARARKSRQVTSLSDAEPESRECRRSQVASAVVGKPENSLGSFREPPATKKGIPSSSQSELLPGVVKIPRFSSINPHWNPARPLSTSEIFLLDHCMPSLSFRCLVVVLSKNPTDICSVQDINFVIPFRNGSCHKAGSESKAWFTNIQLTCWLPFALADPNLLAILFLQSCSSLEVLSAFQSYEGEYNAYKHQCIRYVGDSLSFEGRRASDATIATVIILLCDSVSRPPLPFTVVQNRV